MGSEESQSLPGAVVSVYLIVKALAIYCGVFLACYFWPQFLNSLIGEHGDLRSVLLAGVLITPLGFLILGFAWGKRQALTHIGLLALGAGAATVSYSQFLSETDPLPRLVAIWTPVIILVYFAGFVVAAHRDLQAPR